MGPKLELWCDIVQAREHGLIGKGFGSEYRVVVSKWTIGQRRNKPIQDVGCATQHCRHPFRGKSIACQPQRAEGHDPMYSLQSRDGAARREPDFPRQFVCLVRERQVLWALQEFAKQMDRCPTMPSLRIHHEL